MKPWLAILILKCTIINLINIIITPPSLPPSLPPVWVEKEFQCDRYLAPHARHYVREMRVKAYTQLLESYRSLSLAHMAKCFGVSIAFMDRYIIVREREIAWKIEF